MTTISFIFADVVSGPGIVWVRWHQSRTSCIDSGITKPPWRWSLAQSMSPIVWPYSPLSNLDSKSNGMTTFLGASEAGAWAKAKVVSEARERKANLIVILLLILFLILLFILLFLPFPNTPRPTQEHINAGEGVRVRVGLGLGLGRGLGARVRVRAGMLLGEASVRRGSPDPAVIRTEGLRPDPGTGDLRSAGWQGRETLPQHGEFFARCICPHFFSDGG